MCGPRFIILSGLGFWSDRAESLRATGAIAHGRKLTSNDILAGLRPEAIDLWAVHPGGRSVLDAVETALSLGPKALAVSREILLRYGNMSSATVMFVLQQLMQQAKPGQTGCALGFGPGVAAEIMRFHAA